MDHTFTEITTQTDAWQEAITQTLEAYRPALEEALKGAEQILFIGCGSTYYLSLAAAALFQRLARRPARGVPGGELALNGDTVLDSRPTLLVAVSRSGATTETLRAVERFRQTHGGPVLTITTRGDQPLARMGDVNLVLPQGQEKSVVQTRSFSAMYVATVGLAVLAAGDPTLMEAMHRLPEAGRQVLQKAHEAVKPFVEAEDKRQFFFLGSGPLYGLACEGSLKLKEMSLTVSEPFHFLEFRHGPMSMVGPDTVLVGLLSEAHRAYEEAVLEEMRALGAELLTLGEAKATVAFGSGLPEPLRGALYLPALQLLGYYRARAKGLNPDQPRHLQAVVQANLV